MRQATETSERRWTERYPARANYPNGQHHRQAFHKSRTSYGAAGHFVHLGMIAAPLVLTEVVHDADKRFRYMRFVPIAGAIAPETLWTLRLSQDRKKDEEAKAALAACHERSL